MGCLVHRARPSAPEATSPSGRTGSGLSWSREQPPAQRGHATNTMSWFRPRDLLDQTFEVGIILKGLDGVLEVIGGLLLLIVSPATIHRVRSEEHTSGN